MQAPARGSTAIVLAGGRSSRYGSDKLADLIGGRPLLHHALQAVAPVVAEVVLVVAPRAARGAAAAPLPAMPCPVVTVADESAYPGPLAALATGAAHARNPRLLVVGGDMPSLQQGILARLLAWPADREGACLLLDGEAQPLPVGLSRAAALSATGPLLAGGRRSLRSLLDRLKLERIDDSEWRTLDPHGQSLIDIDRPADRGQR